MPMVAPVPTRLEVEITIRATSVRRIRRCGDLRLFGRRPRVRAPERFLGAARRDLQDVCCDVVDVRCPGVYASDPLSPQRRGPGTGRVQYYRSPSASAPWSARPRIG